MPKQPIVEGATATNPTSGARVIYRQGKWYPFDQDPGGPGATHDPDAPLAALTPGVESRTRLALGLGPAIDAQRAMYKAEQWRPGTASPLGKNPYHATRPMVGAALDSIPDNGMLAPVARLVGGQKFQDYTQAGKTFESAFLPILSGAAVTQSEAQRLIKASLPQVGDTPRTLATKAKNRARMINAAADLLGTPRPFPKMGIMDLGGGSGRPSAQPSAQPQQGPAAAPGSGGAQGMTDAQIKAAMGL